MENSKSAKDIGTLSGKLLVFGGVYSNFQALQKLQQIATSLNISANQIICTGDTVGYCAQPDECIKLIKDWGIHVIAGNIEIQLAEGLEDCGCDFNSGGRCDTFSRQWYPYAKDNLSEDALQWIQQLPHFLKFDYAGLAGICVHGSYFETAGYVFASTDWEEKEKNFLATEADLILAGHCGLPFSQQQDGKYWLNAGVIGMPANDGTPRVWYMILDDKGSKLNYTHHYFNYDHLTTAKLMTEKGLPLPYAKTLQTGLWDNCEILPKEETDHQGVKIRF